jgi:[ribosomal protein S5]-alanine N-acetyltransferase
LIQSPSLPPTLSGARLQLTPLLRNDIDENYVAWLNDPEVVEFSNQRFFSHNLSSCLAYWESFVDSPNWLIAIRDKVGLCGSLSAYISLEHETTDVGIMLGRRNIWGLGYGLEAWGLLGDYLLESIGIRKLTGGTLRENIGMIKIFNRYGMTLEATKRDQEIVNGQPMDLLFYCKFRTHETC